MSNENLNETLNQLKVHDLKALVRKLPIPNPSLLQTKEQLLQAVLGCDSNLVRKRLRKTWIDDNRTGVLIGIVGLVVSIVLGIIALPIWWQEASNRPVIQVDENGSLTLNLDRRNANQCAKFEIWIEKSKMLRNRYFTSTPPTTAEYAQFIVEFTDFAETNFTPSQVRTFNQGFSSGAGGKMFQGTDKLDEELERQVKQIGLIEFWLLDFIKHNRKGLDPSPFDGNFLSKVALTANTIACADLRGVYSLKLDQSQLHLLRQFLLTSQGQMVQSSFEVVPSGHVVRIDVRF